MKSPAYQMYAQDFDMDTKDWTAIEVGIYIRLLNYEWVNGGIPIEPARIARIAGIDPRTCRKLLPVVLTKFGIDEEAKMYVNRRLEEEREIQHKYRESQSIKGKLSAEKRHNEFNHGSTTVQPERQPEVNSSSSSSSSKKDLYIFPQNSFENFWEAYPRRKGVRATKKESIEYLKSVKFNDWDHLYIATVNYSNSDTVKDGYVKDAIRFLKKDYWRDWLEVKEQKKQGEGEFYEYHG